MWQKDRQGKESKSLFEKSLEPPLRTILWPVLAALVVAGCIYDVRALDYSIKYIGERPQFHGLFLLLSAMFVFYLTISLLGYIMVLTGGLLSLLFGEKLGEKLFPFFALLFIGTPIWFLFGYGFWYNDYQDKIENRALTNSYETVGIITQKRPVYRHSLHIWAGIDRSTTKEHGVKEKIYNSKHKYDTVIIKVSKEYPHINRVLDWNPTPAKIRKYKNKPKHP